MVDPSFKGTQTEKFLSEACEKFDSKVHWHSGYILQTDKVPSNFRGPTMPSLARRVAPDGLLNAKKIGDAAASVRRNPNSWVDLGSEKDILQELKLLWHVLLRFG